LATRVSFKSATVLHFQFLSFCSNNSHRHESCRGELSLTGW
jgi:hypothetical protein